MTAFARSLKMELSLNSDYNNNLVVANAITIPFYTSPEISLAMIAPIVWHAGADGLLIRMKYKLW